MTAEPSCPHASGQQALAARTRLRAFVPRRSLHRGSARDSFFLFLSLSRLCVRARVFLCGVRARIPPVTKWQCFWLGRGTRTVGKVASVGREPVGQRKIRPREPGIEPVAIEDSTEPFSVLSLSLVFARSFPRFALPCSFADQPPPPRHLRPSERDVMRPAERN